MLRAGTGRASGMAGASPTCPPSSPQWSQKQVLPLRVRTSLISVPGVLGQTVCGGGNAMVCLHQFPNNYVFNCLLTPSTQVTSSFCLHYKEIPSHNRILKGFFSTSGDSFHPCSHPSLCTLSVLVNEDSTPPPFLFFLQTLLPSETMISSEENAR